MSWIRARFHVNAADYRPIKWPPPGPYWCSGWGDDYSVVMAYVKTEAQVAEFWPEATSIDSEVVKDIWFSSRFPQPSWWPIDPVFEQAGWWHFYDETWSYVHGPWETEEIARDELARYVRHLDGEILCQETNA